ncbi:glycosyltransferase [Flaviflexus huanghaiensis]|uniref:glycosyltransferase n=1 Tax=Flaviflexus huanghaiensis TaxID=1111473 RepID=UPI0015FB4D90|nr:glycosyltransferase [Flaviflexus huanghaiensis]
MPVLRIALTVLHTSPVLQPGMGEAGGLNVYLLNTAQHLAAEGHDVTLITRRDSPELPDAVELAPNLRLVYLSAGPEHPLAKADSEQLIEPFTAALDDWWEPVDVIHSHHWFAGAAAIPVAQERGVPHVQSYHSVAAPVGEDWGAGEQPESPGRPAGERFIANESDRIVAVSRFEADTIIARYGADPERFSIVHPAVDSETFRPTGVDPEPYLVFAARLQPLKGVDLAIRALAEIHEAKRPRLVIAGEPASDFPGYTQQVRALGEELGLEEFIEYRGSMGRDELARLLSGAQVLLNPSHSETYGIINVEAAACGTPVIASRVGGMVDSVLDGDSGYLIPSRDPRQWAAAIERILDDPGLRERLSRSARQFALSRGWREAARELVDVYRGEVE